MRHERTTGCGAAKRRWLAAGVAAAVLMGGPARAHRLHGYTQKYRDVPNPAEPLAASYCGGAGTEYLAGVAIQPDGKIVASGTAIGAPLRIGRAVEAEVLGRDTAEPIYDTEALAGLEYREIREHMGWRHPNRTPFLIRFSADLQDVIHAVRLPWRAGSVTDMACDRTGNVYIAGLAGPTLARAAAVADVSAEPALATTAYVAKLTPDLRKIEWIRTFTDAHKGPLIRINEKQEVCVEGGWLYVFQPDGRLTHTTELKKTGKWLRVVNPRDHTFAVSGESMWGTGREPWRCPHLLIGLPGPKTYRMYQWPGPFAGLNSLRLVSDSVIRKMYIGDDGMLYIAGWSDGGNSVFLREPCDIRRELSYSGLRLECWGVGATSFSHLLKIDPVTAKVRGYTLWSAFRGSDGAPNGLGVDIIRPATDGSVLIAGGSAFGLLQTGNALHKGDPGGIYLTIFERDFSSLRFSSIVPACGMAEVRSNESWGIGTGVSEGRHRAVYVGSAAREGMTYSTGPHPAPTLRAFQPEFGGGLADGWIALFDLGPVTTNRPAIGPAGSAP